MCLDVFRGLAVAGMIIVDNPGDDEKAYWAIKHADWNGWTPADFIFPSFLFLVGVSIVFSFAARLRRGESRLQILLHAFKRSLILIAVGLDDGVRSRIVTAKILDRARTEQIALRLSLGEENAVFLAS
ncbi:MAG: heparan-alpha-glucosaminide N-acetyltransferase domain-containing protein [Candidatus Acidiferrales bacterium]